MHSSAYSVVLEETARVVVYLTAWDQKAESGRRKDEQRKMVLIKQYSPARHDHQRELPGHSHYSRGRSQK